MVRYTTTVVWQREARGFPGQCYSRRHSWYFNGGAVVSAASSPYIVPMPFSDPAAVDPEEAFVASLSSCHRLCFLDVATKAVWVVDSYRDDAVGVLAPNTQGRMAIVGVTLRPIVDFADDRCPSIDALPALHYQASESSFIVNSVKTSVKCEADIESHTRSLS